MIPFRLPIIGSGELLLLTWAESQGCFRPSTQHWNYESAGTKSSLPTLVQVNRLVFWRQLLSFNKISWDFFMTSNCHSCCLFSEITLCCHAGWSNQIILLSPTSNAGFKWLKLLLRVLSRIKATTCHCIVSVCYPVHLRLYSSPKPPIPPFYQSLLSTVTMSSILQHLLCTLAAPVFLTNSLASVTMSQTWQ